VGHPISQSHFAQARTSPAESKVKVYLDYNYHLESCSIGLKPFPPTHYLCRNPVELNQDLTRPAVGQDGGTLLLMVTKGKTHLSVQTEISAFDNRHQAR
jgi:hypothetical protein